MIALQEILIDAKTHRPEMEDKISKIEVIVKDVEDLKNHAKRFNVLDLVVNNFITDADSAPRNIPNTDRLARLKSIKKAINEYKNAYAQYAAHLIGKKGN